MPCLFCGGQEKNYKPPPNTDFICSRCVQLLLSVSQVDLLKAHAKAIKKGYANKARAIESFIIEDETNDRKTKITKRNLERERPMPAIRPTRNQVRA